MYEVKEASHKRPCLILFHFYELSRRGKSIETESRLVVDEGRGEGEVCLTCISFSLGDDNDLEVHSGDDRTAL